MQYKDFLVIKEYVDHLETQINQISDEKLREELKNSFDFFVRMYV